MAVQGMRSRKRTQRFIFQLILTVMALVWLIPIFMMVTVALMPPDQRSPALGGLVVTQPSLYYFQKVWNDNPLPLYFLNSLLITVPSVMLVVGAAALAAFGFSRLRIPGGNFWFYMLLLTLMLPIPTLIIPIMQLARAMGLYNTHLGLVLPYAALGIPFAIVILRSFFDSFPHEIEEAAYLDGCTSFGVFWRIMLPLSLPALAVVIIWQFMISFNEFIMALVMIHADALKPLPLVPLVYSGVYMAQPGAIFAILSIMTIPVVIVYLLMQRWIISGLTAGAVRG
jgi:ABC-type glycerol-3-phosphate transport system permease component